MSGKSPFTEENLREWKEAITEYKVKNLSKLEEVRNSYEQNENEANLKKLDFKRKAAILEKIIIKSWEIKLADLTPNIISITRKGSTKAKKSTIEPIWAEIKSLLKDQYKDGLRIQVGYHINYLVLILKLSI